MRLRVACALLCCGAFSIRALPQRVPATAKTVRVDIRNADGKSAGTATFSAAEPRGVKLELDITNMPPGMHVFHIHQKPVCDASQEFNTAGLQYDPTGELYGNAEHHAHSGPAAGNPGSGVEVASDGTGRSTVVLPNLTLGDDAQSLFAKGGTAIVFHAA